MTSRIATARGDGAAEGLEDDAHGAPVLPALRPKFFAAKSQFARLARKVSTNFGRALR